MDHSLWRHLVDPRLIKEELKQPIRGAACGGTHRLMGFSYAINKRIQRGKPVTGEFARAQKFINDYHRYTFSLQNPDGSFSTQWFTRREASPDVDRRLKTTGHVAEWLTFSLSDEELRDPRVTRAIDYLATILLNDRNRSWEIGPVGHGLHALALYDSPASMPFGRRPSCPWPIRRARRRMPTPPGAADAGPSLSTVDQDAAVTSKTHSDARSSTTSSDESRSTCPAKEPVYEVAEKLRWGMPPCEIGNELEEPTLAAPDSASHAGRCRRRDVPLAHRKPEGSIVGRGGLAHRRF